MKILVTGGAGYIGSVATEQLLDGGHEVVVFDSLELGHREAVDPRARFMQGDLRDGAAILDVLLHTRPDAVMHFAAYALVQESMEKPEIYFRNNVSGGLALLEGMLRAGVDRIVFSSTCATYGQPEALPITEDTPQVPTNPYGESKRLFERMLFWFHERHGMKTLSLRYFNACGATEKLGEDHAFETHLVPIVLQTALGQRERVMIFGDDYDTPDGSCVRDYIHVVDLAQAHILALDSEFSGALNLGNGRGFSVREIVETARKITGRPIPASVGPRRPGDPASLVASADRVRDVLKWKPRHAALADMIESAWEWHRAHPQGHAE